MGTELSVYGPFMKNQSARYRELVVWQRGMQLAAEIYCATMSFPREDLRSNVADEAGGGISPKQHC